MTPYPEYKATNLPWLPQIPAHWDTLKVKYAFSERSEKGFPNEPLLAATQTHGVIPKSIYEARTVEAQKDLHLLKLVKVGDFVISLRSFQGGIEYAYYQGIISPAYTIMIPNNAHIISTYFKYLAKSKSFVKLLQTCVTGIREGQNIDYNTLKRNSIPIPSVAEQEQIVRYLDSMTVKINKLIRAKKKQIALLREQKQAIINQAVTKGLNPNAEMKDSGIDWLGSIPAHWKVNKIFRLFNKIGSGTTPPNELNEFYNNGTIPWVNSGDLYGIEKEIKNVQKKVTVRALEKFTTLRVYPENTIIIAMYGASIGNMGITQFPSCCNQACCCLATPQKELIIDFAYYVLLGCKKRWIEQSNGGGQSNINQDVIKQTWVAFPAIAEQNEIVYALSKRLQKYKFCLEKLRKEINILLEYKNSLIASVVTGQVDVRNIQVEDFDPADLVPETDDDPAEEDDQPQEESEE